MRYAPERRATFGAITLRSSVANPGFTANRTLQTSSNDWSVPPLPLPGSVSIRRGPGGRCLAARPDTTPLPHAGCWSPLHAGCRPSPQAGCHVLPRDRPPARCRAAPAAGRYGGPCALPAPAHPETGWVSGRSGAGHGAAIKQRSYASIDSYAADWMGPRRVCRLVGQFKCGGTCSCLWTGPSCVRG